VHQRRSSSDFPLRPVASVAGGQAWDLPVHVRGVSVHARGRRPRGVPIQLALLLDAAYALFCKHAAHFTQPRTPKPTTRGTGKRRRNMPRASTPPQPTPRDPLLERPKRRLVDRIRILEAENADLAQAAARQALHQQEIEALNMNLRSCLVAAQRDLRSLVAEHTSGPSGR
jgi:hypothetical protein